jgi:hypothetical protein
MVPFFERRFTLLVSVPLIAACEAASFYSSLSVRDVETLLDVVAAVNEVDAKWQALSLLGASEDGRRVAILLAEAAFQAVFLFATQPCE